MLVIKCMHFNSGQQENTVNREIFIVKIFSDSMASAKIKRTIIMHIINDNAVRGRLSKNYLTKIYRTKYL